MESKNLLLSAAVTGLVMGGAALASSGDYKKAPESVHCQEVNGCKGQGACGGATHGCAGQNACKGKGWLKLSQKECDAATAALKESKTKEIKMEKKVIKKADKES
jgi:hypothetical protein